MSGRAQLESDLDGLIHTAAQSIRDKRKREAWSSGIDGALPLLVVLPLIWALGVGVGLLDGVPRALVLPFVISVPLVYLAVRVVRAHALRVEGRDALAVLDRELGLEDRLLSAREFLDTAVESPFVEAALEDAALVVARARSASPRLEHSAWAPTGTTWGILSTSALLLLLVFLVQPLTPAEAGRSPNASGVTEELALLEGVEPSQLQTPPVAQAPEEERPELESPNAPLATMASDAERRDQATALSDQTKESAGKTGEGRSSDAEASSSASESRGQPSNQSQVSKAPEKPAKKPASDKKPKKPSDVALTPKKNEEDDSGSTAGRGSSKGSSKNPVATKWSSKDQVTSQDDQEIEDDEETEDEEEDQESRGGVQPNLRDRKPPVSRDLRIGFGNQKNPDANGRGGPSEAKKSRGTASLVLGVPIPDRVKGQPSPGKTKITQERIEPKPEEEASIEASARRERADSIGFIEERELTPWMRTLVREYFLSLRKKPAAQPTAPPNQ